MVSRREPRESQSDRRRRERDERRAKRDAFIKNALRASQVRAANSVAAQVRDVPASGNFDAASTPFIPPEQLPPVEKDKVDFGGFPGSGVLENIASGAIRLGQNVQKGTETLGGALTLFPSRLIPGEQAIETRFGEVLDERGQAGPLNIAGQAQQLAEAFRRTDFPSVDLPGRGFDVLPGAGEFRLGDTLGFKGAIELAPDVLLGIATAGGTLPVSATKAGATGVTKAVVARTAKGVANAAGLDVAKTVIGQSRRFTASGRAAKEVLDAEAVERLAKNPAAPMSSHEDILGRVAQLSDDPDKLVVEHALDGVSRGPLVGGVLRRLGGIQRAMNRDDVVSRGLVVHTARVEEAPTLITRNMIGKNLTRERFEEVFGKLVVDARGQQVFDAARVARADDTAELIPSQVFEDAHTGKYRLTPEQIQFIDDADAVIEDMALRMGESGVEFGNVIDEAGEAAGSRYFPRLVLQRAGQESRDLQDVARTGGPLKGKNPSHTKARSYLSQGIADGVEAGIRYEADIIALLEEFQNSSYRAMRDTELFYLIRGQGTKVPATGRRVLQTGTTTDNLFRERFFTKADAERIESFLAETSGFTKAASTVGDIARTSAASLDFSAPFIQGILLFGRNPITWGKGMARMMDTFFRPKKYREYLRANLNVIDEMSRHRGVVSGTNEFYAGLDIMERTIRRVPGVGNTAGDTLERFQSAFSFFGDYARIEQWKALRTTASKVDGGLDDLADFVNRSTGIPTPGGLVIPKSQQAWERAFLFFAPRYTRSSLALVGDVFRGGLRGQLARDSMTRMAIGGLLTYYAVSKALGQEAKLDPSKSDFMTVQIGNDRVGIGSFWTSFMRIVADVVTDPGLAGAEGVSELAFESTDSTDTFFDRFDANPIARFFRSRQPIPVQSAWELARGHDYLGNPIDNDIPGIGTHIGESLLPFWIEDSFFGEPLNVGFAGTIAQIGGTRAFPLSLSKRRDAARDEAAVKVFNKTWDELNRLQRESLENDTTGEFENLQLLTQRAREDRVVRGRGISDLVDEWYKVRENIEADWFNHINESYKTQVTTGDIDLERFRKEVIQTANTNRRAALNVLSDDERYAPVIEYFSALDTKPGANPEKPEDVAYFEFVSSVVADPDLYKLDGFDYRLRAQKVAEFREEWGDEVYNYVLTLLDEGRNIPPIVRELYKGSERFGNYWGSSENRASVPALVIARRRDSTAVKQLYERWEAEKTDLGKQALEEQHPNLRSVLKMISSVRRALRQRDQEMDAFLYRWGYTSTLIHQNNRFKGAEETARGYLARLDQDGQTNYILRN